jgi:hypothetical protein
VAGADHPPGQRVGGDLARAQMVLLPAQGMEFLGAFGHGKEQVICWAALSPQKTTSRCT